MYKCYSKCTRGINEQILKTSGPDVLSSRKKIKKIIRGKRAGDEVGGAGWGGGVATKGKECHHHHFGKLHPTIEDRQFQAMHFLREVRDNIKRISHFCLVFATSVDGLAY